MWAYTADYANAYRNSYSNSNSNSYSYSAINTDPDLDGYRYSQSYSATEADTAPTSESTALTGITL
jgi:hypothetical protein